MITRSCRGSWRVAAALVATLECSLYLSPAAAQDQLIRRFTAGAGLDSVGILDASEDTEIEGPQAIYAGDRGEVYLLDQSNGRVLEIDPKDQTKPPLSMELPAGMRPTDLIVQQEKVFVWDGAVRGLDIVGDRDSPVRGLTLTRASEPVDETTLSAFAQMGSQELPAADATPDGLTRSLGKAETRPRQAVASRGRGPVLVDFDAAKDNSVEMDIRPKGGGDALARIRMQVKGRLGAVELLEIDRSGRYFVLGENVPADGLGPASVFVARYAAKGQLEGIHELPLSETAGLSRRFVTVSPEGDVYFLRTRKQEAAVLGVSFRPWKPGVPIDAAGPAAGPANVQLDLSAAKGLKAAVHPLNRQEVLQNAYAFANLRWVVNPVSYGPDPDRGCSGFNRIRRPGYLQGKKGQEVQGVPYCWGCFNPLPKIAGLMAQGALAGNVCTRDDPRRDVVGVDCSAFVSAAWGLSRHFTTIAIPSIASQLSNPWDLLPGDALNKPGSHVQLFIRFTPDKKAEVIESSTGGCNGKVCRNVYPLGALLARGYRPVRYRGLAQDNSTPIPVAAQAPAVKK